MKNSTQSLTAASQSELMEPNITDDSMVLQKSSIGKQLPDDSKLQPKMEQDSKVALNVVIEKPLIALLENTSAGNPQALVLQVMCGLYVLICLHSSLCLAVSLTCLSICLSLCLTHLSVHLSVSPSHSPVCPSVCLSVSLTCLSICLSLCLTHLSVHLSVSLSCSSVCLSLCL